MGEKIKKLGEDGSLRLFVETIRALGRTYYLLVGGILLLALTSLLPAQLLRFFTEGAHSLSSINAETFVTQLSIFGGLIALCLWISRAGSVLLQERLRLSLESVLRSRILQTLHATPLNILEQSQRGDWYSRVTGDLTRVEMYLAEIFPTQVRLLTIATASGVLFLFSSGAIAFVPLVAALFLCWVNLRLHHSLSPRLKELRTFHSGILQGLIENFEGIRTIRSHGAESFMAGQFDSQLRRLSDRSMQIVRLVGSLMGANELFSQALVTICLVGIAFALKKGSLQIHEALLYPFYIGMFFTSVQDFAKTAYDWNRYRVEGGRLAEFLHRPLNDGRTTAPMQKVSAGRILARHLAIGYVNLPALKTIEEFEIRQGELLLVRGHSGSGKSTLLETLAGLRPALAGKFFIDGKNVFSLRDFFTFVEQRPYIFEGSVRGNLLLGKLDIDDKSIWEALELVSLAEVFRKRDGLDATLYDRGENLSEGERYRLAMARAFLLERPFLLLDEPFASIDARAVDGILRALENLRSVRGIVVVSHQIPEGFEPDSIVDFDDKIGLSKVPHNAETMVKSLMGWGEASYQ